LRPIAGFLLNRRCESVEAALKLSFSKKYCSPGLWAAFAVMAQDRKWPHKDVFEFLEQNDQLAYGRAIGIEAAIGAPDTYHHERVNKGANYSPLAVLDVEERTNEATKDIAGCIRTWFNGTGLEQFVAELCDVVGDLHDNVWSHAKSTGVSMATKWCQQDGNVLEFALADAGYGFLGELRRSGVLTREGIATATEAIAWCVVKGNSSKIKKEDPWAQRLPEDAMGNPMGAIARIVSKENNHLGLGLAKLEELVTKFKGQLWLASGDGMLTIDNKGGKKYQRLPFSWKGVLLECRFNVTTVEQVVASQEVVVDEIDSLIGSLLTGPNV
jgi:hypothetical protein